MVSRGEAVVPRKPAPCERVAQPGGGRLGSPVRMSTRPVILGPSPPPSGRADVGAVVGAVVVGGDMGEPLACAGLRRPDTFSRSRRAPSRLARMRRAHSPERRAAHARRRAARSTARATLIRLTSRDARPAARPRQGHGKDDRRLSPRANRAKCVERRRVGIGSPSRPCPPGGEQRLAHGAPLVGVVAWLTQPGVPGRSRPLPSRTVQRARDGLTAYVSPADRSALPLSPPERSCGEDRPVVETVTTGWSGA